MSRACNLLAFPIARAAKSSPMSTSVRVVHHMRSPHPTPSPRIHHPLRLPQVCTLHEPTFSSCTAAPAAHARIPPQAPPCNLSSCTAAPAAHARIPPQAPPCNPLSPPAGMRRSVKQPASAHCSAARTSPRALAGWRPSTTSSVSHGPDAQSPFLLISCREVFRREFQTEEI